MLLVYWIKILFKLTCLSLAALGLTTLYGCSGNKRHVSKGYYGHNHLYLQKSDSAPILTKHLNIHAIPDAIPKIEPKSRTGNPSTYKVFNKRYKVLNSSKGYKAKGIASWYGKKFHGFKTSSGEIYDMYKMSAAHKTLPLPTYAQVTNLDNGRKIIVKINDRGPFHANRLIDLSYAAAIKLGITDKGTGKVEVTAINPKKYRTKYNKNNIPPPLAPHNPASFLQLGAFSDKQNAQNLVSKLNNIQEISKYKVKIHNAPANTSPLFKVLIGPIAKYEEINKLKSILLTQKLPSAFTIYTN